MRKREMITFDDINRIQREYPRTHAKRIAFVESLGFSWEQANALPEPAKQVLQAAWEGFLETERVTAFTVPRSRPETR